MPERIFAYTQLPDLLEAIQDLTTALTSGSTQEMRSNHTGFLKATGPISQVDLKRRLMDARYEIFWRGYRGISPAQSQQSQQAEIAQCAALEPVNPYSEKKMRVETIYRAYPYMQQPFYS